MKQLVAVTAVMASLLVLAHAADATTIQTFTAEASSSTAHKPADLTLRSTTSSDTGAKPSAVVSMKIAGPRGKVNLGVASRCKRSSLEETGECPSTSQLLVSGSAVEAIQSGGVGDLVIDDIKAYLLSGRGPAGAAVLAFSEPQTGERVLIDVRFEKSGTRTVIDIPNIKLPEVFGVVPALVDLDLTINGKMKRKVKVIGGPTKARYLYLNPASCTEMGWTYAADIGYADGTSKRVESTQKCERRG